MIGPIYGIIFNKAHKKAITTALSTLNINKVIEYIVNKMES
jgi:hypothetical protein